MSTARPQAVPTVFIDNERAIVTEWRFAPGAETGWHRHGHDYIVVPTISGLLKLELPDGKEATAELVAGKPYARQEGVEHNVINASAHEIAFIEIEMKRN